MADDVLGMINKAFQKVLESPETIFNMKGIKSVSIQCALLFKTFFDEFFLKHNKKPNKKSPRDKKVRAVFNHLGLSKYRDVAHLHYNDIDCWQIKVWDQSDRLDMSFSEVLSDEIIPKCWSGDHAMSKHSSNIATSVSEPLWNCKEHAYAGGKKDSNFRKMYLGVGEYPGTGRFSFCIYDKGIGIIKSMKDNPEGWFEKIADLAPISDSKMIEKATHGRSGASIGKRDGRGKGLKEAIDLLSSNQGQLDIFSDRGFFSTYNKEASGLDRDTQLEGTMVAFSFPIGYTLS